MITQKVLIAIIVICCLTAISCSYKAKESTSPVGTGAISATPPAEVSAAPAEAAATVNGKIIPKSDLDNVVKMYSQSMNSNPSNNHAQMNEAQQKELRQKILNQMIQEEVLYQAAVNAGFSKDADQKIAVEYDRVVKQYGSEEAFANEAKKNNFTLAQVKEQIKRGVIIRSYLEKEFTSKIIVTEEEIKTFYEQNSKLFERPEQVKASHILCKVPLEDATKDEKDAAMEKIKKVQERLKSGEKFEDVAKEVSDCPSAAQGGDLGTFGRAKMVKPFEDAAFALKVGELSDIVETQFGYHIIKVTEKKETGKVPLEEVRAKIEDNLKKKDLQKKLEAFIKELREKAKIQIINNDVEKKG